MPRKIVIETYDGNTVYSVAVFDSYGTEHHLGYISAHKIGEILIDNKELQLKYKCNRPKDLNKDKIIESKEKCNNHNKFKDWKE